MTGSGTTTADNRMLACSFERRGIGVRADLLGDDDPKRMEAFHREVFAWAGPHDPA